MSRNILLLIGIGVTVLVALVLIIPVRTVQVEQVAPPQPTPPATAIYEGSVYDCSQVIKSTEEGEHYMPDGRPIYAILLADCDY